MAADTKYVEVLLYSDNVHTREAVRDAVGLSLGQGYPEIKWVEVATTGALRQEFTENRFAVLVLDGEATPEGGASIARALHDLTDLVPPILLLTARPQDEWLARWARVTQTVSAPLDPIEVEDAMRKLLRP